MLQNLVVLSMIISLFGSFGVVLAFVFMISRCLHGMRKFKVDHMNEAKARYLAKVITKHHQWCDQFTEVSRIGRICTGTCISIWPKFYWAQVGRHTSTWGGDTATATTKFDITLWCTESTYNWLMDCEKRLDTDSRLVLDRAYIWHDPILQLRERPKLNIKKTKTQDRIIEEIKQLYHHPTAPDLQGKHIVVCYLIGRPGTGKSKVSTLIAQDLGGVRVKVNPTKKGFSARKAIESYDSTYESPLIIDMSDYDKSLLKCLKRKPKDKENPPEVTCVEDHDSLFDDFHEDYDNLIVIVSGNKPPGEITEAFKDIDVRKDRIESRKKPSMRSTTDEKGKEPANEDPDDFDQTGSLFRQGRLDYIAKFTDKDRIFNKDKTINNDIFIRKDPEPNSEIVIDIGGSVDNFSSKKEK